MDLAALILADSRLLDLLVTTRFSYQLRIDQLRISMCAMPSHVRLAVRSFRDPRNSRDVELFITSDGPPDKRSDPIRSARPNTLTVDLRKNF